MRPMRKLSQKPHGSAADNRRRPAPPETEQQLMRYPLDEIIALQKALQNGIPEGADELETSPISCLNSSEEHLLPPSPPRASILNKVRHFLSVIRQTPGSLPQRSPHGTAHGA